MTILVFRTNAALTSGIIETADEFRVPVVAVIAGELNGETLDIAEIEKSLPAWEGVPVTLGHPAMDDRVQGLVRNAQDIVVGKLREVRIVSNSMRGLAVFKKRASEKVDTIIQSIKDGRLYEVSTGYLAKMDGLRQHSITPDHLAILPNEQGACSWLDGCGLPRQNQGYTPKGTKMNEEQVQEMIDAALAAAGEKTTAAIAEATDGFTAKIDELSEIVQNTVALGEGKDEDGEDAGDIEDDTAEGIAGQLPAEIQGIVDAVATLGGAEGITSALAAVKSNADAQRASLIEEIKANSSSFTDEDLQGIETDVLAKMAASVRPATFQFGRVAQNAEAGEWEPYDSE